MKNKNKIFIFSIALVLTGLLPSCDFLNVDSYFEDTFNPDSIFSSKYNIERYYNGAVTLLPDEGKIFQQSYIPGVTGSDEAITCGYDYPFLQSWNGTKFINNQYTATNSPFNGLWGSMYKIIRKCNILLSNIDAVPDMDLSAVNSLRAKVRFLRAYAYYHLFVNYGPCILLGDKVLDTNETPEYYALYRGTYDECADYICSEFEAAAEGLPIKQSAYTIGTPSRGAALSLVARMRLEQASDLFNGGNSARLYFGTWKRKSDNANYISQEYDERRWAIAAHAAYRVIELSAQNNNLYTLHTVEKDSFSVAIPANVPSAPFPDGAGGIDAFKSYANMFNGDTKGESAPLSNKEFIWGRVTSGALTDMLYPTFPDAYGGMGRGVLAIPQKVIDAYYMADGRDISNSSAEYPYEESGFMATANQKKFSDYNLNTGGATYRVAKMYDNREMRFYASIGFSNCHWPMSSAISVGKYNQYVQYYNTSSLDYYCLSGYVCKKFIHSEDARTGDQARVYPKSFPIIRYAEILLAYVEALNNLTTTYTIVDNGTTYTYSRDEAEMAKYFNMIRYRVGLPGLTPEQLASQTDLFNVIVRERLIEFLFENRRYYDIRRWGIVEDIEKNEPIEGMDVSKSRTQGYYTRVPVSHRVIRERNFQRKMMYIPIPLQEIRRVPTIDQNPGWEY